MPEAPHQQNRAGKERSTWLKIASAGSLAAVFFFAFAAELILTYCFSKRPTHTRILDYAVVYGVIGVTFGIGIGAAHEFMIRLGGRRIPPCPEALFSSLSASGLIFFLAFVVLNARLMPHAGMFSARGLALNLALVFAGFILFLYLYHTAKSAANHAAPSLRTVSVCASAAMALGVLHAFVSRAIGTASLGVLHSAGVIFLFLAVGLLVVSVEGKLLSLTANGNISRRIFPAKLLIVVAILLSIMFAKRYRPAETSAGNPSSGARPSGRPNIIIVVLDTVRQDRLSIYGYGRETSPNIAKFAQEAWVFDAYSTATWTLPSHASILTGLYPTETGTGLGRNYHFDGQNETIAEILREAGYSTAAIMANHMVLGHSSGFDQGFDYYHVILPETDLAFPFFASYLMQKFLPGARVFNFISTEEARRTNKAAIRWIEKKSREPFFLFINHIDPHAPYAPPPRIWTEMV